ncbi:MAG TPA: hypothetical protein VI795_00385 [Patescibacteria group bacterium]|nr:hypothetical protein [Patescibacteria group bacterium]
MGSNTTFDAIQFNSGLPAWVTFVTPMFFLLAALPYLFGIAGIVLIFNVISSGYKMMTSVGDPKVLQAAQAKLNSSLIGLLIIFASFWVVNLILKFFGISFSVPIIIN